MQKLAPEVGDWLDQSAVLGVWEVARKYSYFSNKMGETLQRIQETQPDVVIPIDYPGFNLRLARNLRQKGYQGKIAYYISPQVWAWKRGRIKEMARTLDLMLCIFPFEQELYGMSGLETEFVGHPLIDELAQKRVEIKRDPYMVGLFPGSRRREVEVLYPEMLGAAEILHKKWPKLHFVTAAVNQPMALYLRETANKFDVEVRIHHPEAGPMPSASAYAGHADIHTLMQQCCVAVIASGTATLEAAYFRLPYCLVYKVNWLTAEVARLLMRVEHLGIVNNLAGREIVRELLQERADSRAIAFELARMLTDADYRNQLADELGEVVEFLGEGGAHERAAEAILALLEGEG